MTQQTQLGLSADEVRAARDRHGSNVIANTTSRSLAAILRANVFTLFNGIVVGCFVLLGLLGRWQDALFGFSVVANSIIGVWQEYSAKRQLDNLQVLHTPHAGAYRDGSLKQIDREDLVVGDVIALRTGDQIPADAVAQDSRGLQVDESLLSGEEDAVDKNAGAELLAGAIVVAGSATATVSRVGEHSFAAKLTSEAKRFSLVDSEIRNGINRVLRIVAWLLVPVLIIVANGQAHAFGGWEEALASEAWRDAVVGAVAAAIAMVPLGLLLMTSVAFANGAVQLGRRKVLVQELHAVEGLARVDVLCFDKTGTLTEGGVKYDSVHTAAEPQAGWERALASFAADDGANDTAASISAGFGAELADPVVATVQFDSRRKWSALEISSAPGSWILGAPDIILHEESDAELLARVAELSDRGLRVLALSQSPERLSDPGEIDDETAVLPGERQGVAIVVLRERIRSDAAQTVRYFAAEGVDLRIISGDDPRTVTAVAHEVGLIPTTEHGIDGRSLPTHQDELAEVLETHRVFGRVTPEQKREMVRAMQLRGHVVAMTGDGVNDVLALKEADLGISMGHGSGAARAVSRLTLLDNQFEALPEVVRQGRQAIANVERVSMLYLSKTAWAILIAILFGLLLWPYPFEPRQMSILDGISIGWPAFVLALLPNSRRYVRGFFRRAISFAVPAGVVITVAIVVTAILAERAGQTTAQSQTAAAIVLAVLSLWILSLVSRPFRPLLVAVLLGSIAVLFVVLFVPLTSWFFGFEWPESPVLVGVAIICVAGCGLLEIHGWVRRRSAARDLEGSARR